MMDLVDDRLGITKDKSGLFIIAETHVQLTCPKEVDWNARGSK